MAKTPDGLTEWVMYILIVVVVGLAVATALLAIFERVPK